MNHKKEIDFIGIGAQKAGTSWLYYNLKKIKGFDLPIIKELHYFDRDTTYPSPNFLSKTNVWRRILNKNYVVEALKKIRLRAKLKDWSGVKFYIKWYFSNYTDDWYLSLFNNLNGYKGEISPSYSILEEKDIRRMYKLAPNAKLVFLLRNPIDRAWSHYRFAKEKNFIKFPTSIENHSSVIKFMEDEEQVLRSDYLRTMENFSSIFPKNQILICFYDSITDNPELLMRNILEFICEDNSITYSYSNLSKIYNKSTFIKCPKNIEDYLKEKYHNQIKTLADQYGGYFNKWYKDTYGEESTNKNKMFSPTLYLK